MASHQNWTLCWHRDQQEWRYVWLFLSVLHCYHCRVFRIKPLKIFLKKENLDLNFFFQVFVVCFLEWSNFPCFLQVSALKSPRHSLQSRVQSLFMLIGSGMVVYIGVYWCFGTKSGIRESAFRKLGSFLLLIAKHLSLWNHNYRVIE